MNKPRCNFTAISCSNYIYAIGGRSNNTSATNTVEKYNPCSNNWTYTADMWFEKSDHAACVMDGKIYVVGGRDRSEEAVKRSSVTIRMLIPGMLLVKRRRNFMNIQLSHFKVF